MVLTPHALIGTAMYALIPHPWIGLPLAFLSHFAADWIPHNHYHTEDSQTREFAFTFSNFLKVVMDFSLGLALASFIAWRHDNILFIGAGFLAMFPDGLSFIRRILAEQRFSGAFQKILLYPLTLLERFHRRIHAKEDPSNPVLALLQPLAAIGAFLIGYS